MINNYVKTGLIPHPDKKKYTKEHLAGLMAVCMLKQVLPIQDIKTLFSGGMDPTPTPCSARPTPSLGGNLPQPGGNMRQRGRLEAGGPPFGGGGQRQAAAAQRILSLLGEDVPKKPKEKGEGKGANS